jgi:hypothetical protein
MCKYKDGTRVRIQLPETISIPCSITCLTEKTIKNESPYQGKIAIVTGENYKTGKNLDDGETWYFVKLEDVASAPAFLKNQMLSLPESSLIPL